MRNLQYGSHGGIVTYVPLGSDKKLRHFAVMKLF
ncbi:hypothetical protein O987_15235 [Comamonas testosteroni TK102]|uniref:Uncharacterized protein n=1 Tax=Comamonas testosteroni TK102 TaxID=1392005 RepID=A0A076PN31_COMTE|nr:hypothetical protein O987_15235 [Comamonas testosteroni TK102]